MNDIIRSSLFVIIEREQQEMIRNAERTRLLNEAIEGSASRFSRFVRLPLGRSLVAAGRWTQGCSAAARPDEIGSSPALEPAD